MCATSQGEPKYTVHFNTNISFPMCHESQLLSSVVPYNLPNNIFEKIRHTW